MPRNSERGGPQTRARIAEVAAPMFLARGFDDVTVAEIAREAGVSSVTVFKHFPKKEDLYLDRSADAEAFLREAVCDRPSGSSVLDSLEALALRLFDERHPLSAVDERSVPFFRTVAASPALVARARGIAAELQQALRDELEADASFTGDAALLAALFIAGYASVMVGTASRMIAGESPDEVLAGHRHRLEVFFEVLRHGVTGGNPGRGTRATQ